MDFKTVIGFHMYFVTEEYNPCLYLCSFTQLHSSLNEVQEIFSVVIGGGVICLPAYAGRVRVAE